MTVTCGCVCEGKSLLEIEIISQVELKLCKTMTKYIKQGEKTQQKLSVLVTNKKNG